MEDTTAPAPRRQIVVDRGFQFKLLKIWIGLGVTMVVLGWGSFFLATVFLRGGVADPMVMRMMAFMDIIILLFCALVGVQSVALSHRVAGAALNLQRCLDSLRANRLDLPIKLRAGDELQGLAQSVTALRDGLQRRQDAAVGALRALDQVDGASVEELRRAIGQAKDALLLMTAVEEAEASAPRG